MDSEGTAQQRRGGLAATQTPENDPSRLDQPLSAHTRRLRKLAAPLWRAFLSSPESNRALEGWLDRRAALWLRRWPERSARLLSGRILLRARRAAARLARKESATRQRDEMRILAERMLVKGQAEEWSRRKLVSQAGLSLGAFHRALAGQLEPTVWLLRIREAAGRLGA